MEGDKSIEAKSKTTFIKLPDKQGREATHRGKRVTLRGGTQYVVKSIGRHFCLRVLMTLDENSLINGNKKC